MRPIFKGAAGRGLEAGQNKPPTHRRLGRRHLLVIYKRMENTNKFSSGKKKSSMVEEATRGLLYQSRCVSKSATSVVWEIYARLRVAK